MKKVYLDKTEATMCLGVIVDDAEVIFAGATVSSMSVKHKNSEYQRYAEEFDIHFIFDDNLPLLDFYTIPQIDVFATDSDGGVIGSLGRAVDLESEAPICYIDHNQNCFLIANDGKKFLENARQWKTLLVPCTEVEFFSSKEEAKNKYEFLDRDAIEQSLKIVKTANHAENSKIVGLNEQRPPAKRRKQQKSRVKRATPPLLNAENSKKVGLNEQRHPY